MTTATAIGLRQPAPFDYQRNCSNAARWETWVRQFNMFILAAGIKEDEQQVNTFLYVVGEDISEIYNALGATKTKVDEAIKVITDHFKPATLKDNAILTFRKMRQVQGETIDSYVDRLRVEVKRKGISDAENNIRLQLITGAISNKIRIKAESEDMALNDLLTYARTVESLHEYHHVQQPNKLNTIKQEQVNQVYKQNNRHQYQNKEKNHHQFRGNQQKQFSYQQKYVNKNSSNTRGMCGFEYPHKTSCPALGKKCNNCGRLNHFTKCCRTKPTSSFNSQKPYISKQMHKTNYIATNECETSCDESSTEQQAYMLQNQYNDRQSIKISENEIYNAFALTNKKSTKCPRVDVWIGNNKISMGPDTQSSINAISIETYNQLNPKPKLIANESLVYSYDSKKPMKSVGKFDAHITANNRSITTTIMVFQNVCDNLLSFKSCVELQILDQLIDQTHSIETKDDYQDLISKYPTVFTNSLGKLKDFKLKFHINEKIKPFIEKPRRHPIHLKEKLEAKLIQMEKDGIIEDAKGPTPWVSELIAVPKPNQPDKLRIVMDARAVNCAIERERHNTPTLDELVVDLNGAKFFSKIDLIDAHHQIEIGEKSRYLNVFRTSLGLKQYKRLTQGIKSSQDQFHHALETRLSGLKGVKNLIDDMYVHGETRKEHDERLIALLDRLKSLGLTANKEKCRFGETKLDFYGLNFSQNDIYITEQKLKALRAAKTPKTASELRSFLGLATWCSRSIENFATISDCLW